jgi:hypothetical protein
MTLAKKKSMINAVPCWFVDDDVCLFRHHVVNIAFVSCRALQGWCTGNLCMRG